MLATATTIRAPSTDVATPTLVTHCPHGPASGHDRESRANVARRLAQVMHWQYGGAYDPGVRYGAPLYVVPHDALLTDQAAVLGIRGPHDLFGGVVPHAFIATKAITHPLLAPDAAAPVGWSHACAELMGGAALRGYTAFERGDAKAAARELLRDGPVRIKSVLGIGGAGQHLVRTEEEIDAALAAIGDDELALAGVAIEEHLENAVTYSVGAVTLPGIEIAYCGTQTCVRNPRGHDVYGGSTLDVIRGGFDELLAAGLPQLCFDAVELAQAYDALVRQRGVDRSSIAVVGSSYGGYLAAILSAHRPVRWLVLRVPALYKDSEWKTPKDQLRKLQQLEAYRRLPVKSDESCALLACAQFRGDALVVESERDAIIPAQVVTNYRDALGGAASLTYRLMSNADHALSSDAEQQCYTTLLVHWLSEMIKGARAESQTTPVIAKAPKVEVNALQ